MTTFDKGVGNPRVCQVLNPLGRTTFDGVALWSLTTFLSPWAATSSTWLFLFTSLVGHCRRSGTSKHEQYGIKVSRVIHTPWVSYIHLHISLGLVIPIHLHNFMHNACNLFGGMISI
jgi:hypothetical protein